MAAVESLPREYGYVVLVGYCFLNDLMIYSVGEARKKYNVHYPTMYANEADNKHARIFNCVQRGHQNSLENMPNFFMLMILGGIQHPLICASIGVMYSVARFFYIKSYSTGDPEKRLTIGHAYMSTCFCSKCKMNDETGDMSSLDYSAFFMCV